MSQNKYKYSGKDARKNETQHEKSSDKDVELCLEVEMDDEVRQIITSPEKCASTLLDVTVIKPKDLDQLYCSHKATLSGDEVRKLIASMELEKKDKRKLIDKILSSEDPQSSGDYVKKKYVKKVSCLPKTDRQRISSTDDTNSDPVYSCKQKLSRKYEERAQQIFTTPKTYNDIKSIFTCKNKNKYDQDEKPDRPCLCRNCAIIGVLTDSQKKPFVTENLYDPRDLLSNTRKEMRDINRKKCVNFKDDADDHIECELYFRHLSAKIRRLEERLGLQEEKSVAKDYFKRIITKLVTHLSKITNYAGQDVSYVRPKSREGRESYKTKDRYGDNRFHAHPVLIESKLSKTELEELLSASNNFKSSDKCQQNQEGFWKWGEEILKPGIDLKNKIVVLLEDTLHSLRKPRSVPSKLEGIEKLLDCGVVKPQKLQSEIPVRDMPNDKPSCLCKNCPNSNNNNSGSTLPKTKKSRSYEKRIRRNTRSRQNCRCEDLLNVSYLNPKMQKWQEESLVSFKLESSDMDSLKYSEERRLNDACKYW